jgi:hypothetical protein
MYVKFLAKVWPSSFLNFLMSKHVKFSEFLEIREIAPVLDSVFILRTCTLKNKSHFYTLGVINK